MWLNRSMSIEQAKKIHCIGIHGIGVSALAEFLHTQGKAVSGYDDQDSKSKIQIPNGVDLIIYSDAVPEEHVQRVVAKERGIPELSYAQALGEISRKYKTIVVTGTHGKSTTTALLGLMLEAAGMDPLVIVGSKVSQWKQGNLRIGKGGWFVVEGDDYRDHFLELEPYAVVVTSIEWDHPDYFRDLEHTVESFKKLCAKVLEGGFVLLNQDDVGCQQLFSEIVHSPIPRNRRMNRYGRENVIFSRLQLQVPGEFNRYNATAAATAALELGVPREVVKKVAHEFKGIWRRFEVVGELRLGGPLEQHWERLQAVGRKRTLAAAKVDRPAFAKEVLIISDYGHHPTAIRVTMKAAREAYPGRRLVLVYQPHQHSRTKHLFNDFVEVLKDAADLTIVSEIYAVKGRMEEKEVSSQDIVKAISHKPLAISQVLYGGDLAETKRIVLEQVKQGDVVIFMGAGDIDELARELVRV